MTQTYLFSVINMIFKFRNKAAQAHRMYVLNTKRVLLDARYHCHSFHKKEKSSILVQSKKKGKLNLKMGLYKLNYADETGLKPFLFFLLLMLYF